MQPYEEEWTLFRSFDEEAPARGMCMWLRNEQVAARVERRDVFIPKSMRHRAEWIVAQLPPSEEDLHLAAVTDLQAAT